MQPNNDRRDLDLSVLLRSGTRYISIYTLNPMAVKSFEHVRRYLRGSRWIKLDPRKRNSLQATILANRSRLRIEVAEVESSTLLDLLVFASFADFNFINLDLHTV